MLLCCTVRDTDDEALCHGRNRSSRSNRSTPRRPVAGEEDSPCGLDDGSEGCTGGTKRIRHENGLCDATEFSGRLDLISAFACVENRGAGTEAGRQALFGDKSLQPKLLRLKIYETEVEALMQIRTQLSKRLPAEAGQPVAVPVALEAGMNRIPETELVNRLRLHEESLVGVPEYFVTQACHRTFGVPIGVAMTSVELKDMKKHYAEILNNVDVLVQERISKLHTELTNLDAEVEEIEELIDMCWFKIDEEDNKTISSGQFVAFVCEQDSLEIGKQKEAGVSPDGKALKTIVVSPEDAECLFIKMSHGEGEITFEQFKEEITAGCLQIMQANIDIRRTLSKQYRDYWF